MIVSPLSSRFDRSAIVESTKVAGTMIQTLRGASSLPTRSSRSFAPTAPWSASCFTASGFTSYTTQFVAGPHESQHHAGAHAAETDHAQLHRRLSCCRRARCSSYPVTARFARNTLGDRPCLEGTAGRSMRNIAVRRLGYRSRASEREWLMTDGVGGYRGRRRRPLTRRSNVWSGGGRASTQRRETPARGVAATVPGALET